MNRLLLLLLCGVALGVDVTWDMWGVPHIYAGNVKEMAYGLGWATAEDHGNLLLKLYGESRCKAAQYWGGAANIEQDMTYITLGVRELGESFYRDATSLTRDILDGFAKGVQDRVSSERSLFSDEALVVLDDQPITGLDVATHLQFIMQIYSSQTAFPRLYMSQGTTRHMTTLDDTSHPTWWMRSYLQRLKDKGRFDDDLQAAGMGLKTPERPYGSNANAVRRTGGGSVMHINSHLDWTPGGSLTRLYEFEVRVTETNTVFYGATHVGLPLPAMGFAQTHGWAHTINTVSSYSLFKLQVKQEGGALLYLLDGEWVPFSVTSYSIDVKDGSPMPVNVLQSKFGPVVLFNGAEAVVYRWARAVHAAQGKPWGILDQIWKQMNADGVDEFKSAVKMHQMPMFTYVYGDYKGDLLFVSNSWTPDYGDGDWAKWGMGGPVAVNTSRYLWNEIVPFDRMPQVTSPSSGYITHANDPPWQATMPLYTPRPEDSPAWYSPQPDGNNADFAFRPKANHRALREAMRDGKMSLRRLKRVSVDTEIQSTRYLLEDLLQSAEASSSPAVQRAAEVLRKWDGHARTCSRGYALWERFRRAFVKSPGTHEWREPFDVNRPLDTPKGIVDRAEALKVLEEVVAQMDEDRWELNSTWGTYKKLPVDNKGIEWPLTGSKDDSVRNSHSPLRPTTPGGTVTGTWGGTWKCVVEFTPKGTARAYAHIGYGEQTQPNAPHNADEWQMYSENRYRRVLQKPMWVRLFTERKVSLPNPL